MFQILKMTIFHAFKAQKVSIFLLGLFMFQNSKGRKFIFTIFFIKTSVADEARDEGCGGVGEQVDDSGSRKRVYKREVQPLLCASVQKI